MNNKIEIINNRNTVNNKKYNNIIKCSWRRNICTTTQANNLNLKHETGLKWWYYYCTF